MLYSVFFPESSLKKMLYYICYTLLVVCAMLFKEPGITILVCCIVVFVIILLSL